MERSLNPLLDICAACPALTLATMSKAGIPAAATLFFAYTEDLHLYFLSEKHTQHVQNFLENPQVALTIQPETWDWQKIHGIQMLGRAKMIENTAEQAQIRERYRRRFPVLENFGKILPRIHWFEISPTWVRLIDNRKTFASKKEWQFE